MRSQLETHGALLAAGYFLKDHPMPVFLLDVMLGAVVIGLLVYLVIASAPPKQF